MLSWAVGVAITIIALIKPWQPLIAAEVTCSRQYRLPLAFIASQPPSLRAELLDTLQLPADQVSRAINACTTLRISGRIEPGDAERVRRIVSAHSPFLRDVALSSPGGNLREALLIAEIVHRERLRTHARSTFITEGRIVSLGPELPILDVKHDFDQYMLSRGLFGYYDFARSVQEISGVPVVRTHAEYERIPIGGTYIDGTWEIRRRSGPRGDAPVASPSTQLWRQLNERCVEGSSDPFCLCFSACFIIWIAGIEREGDAFAHRFYVPSELLVGQPFGTLQEAAGELRSQVDAFLERHGVNSRIRDHVWTTTPDSFVLVRSVLGTTHRATNLRMFQSIPATSPRLEAGFVVERMQPTTLDYMLAHCRYLDRRAIDVGAIADDYFRRSALTRICFDAVLRRERLRASGPL
jgi:hypothetical protein